MSRLCRHLAAVLTQPYAPSGGGVPVALDFTVHVALRRLGRKASTFPSQKEELEERLVLELTRCNPEHDQVVRDEVVEAPRNLPLDSQVSNGTLTGVVVPRYRVFTGCIPIMWSILPCG